MGRLPVGVAASLWVEEAGEEEEGKVEENEQFE